MLHFISHRHRNQIRSKILNIDSDKTEACIAYMHISLTYIQTREFSLSKPHHQTNQTN